MIDAAHLISHPPLGLLSSQCVRTNDSFQGYTFEAESNGQSLTEDRKRKNMDDEISQQVKSLRWEDKFFANEEGVIAVFDFDYPKIASFNESVACVSMLLCPQLLVVGSLFCYPCFFQKQIKWDVYSQHVAVTRDGIKYVKDMRHTGCGLACQDAGKVSKTVPFDKITDCDIREPAGATCCCIDNVLTVVNVDTASSGGVNPQDGTRMPELTLAGLKDPHGLKKLVWAMKRVTAGGQMGPSISAPLLSASVMDRGFGNEDTNAILCDIRKELKVLNANMKNITGSSSE